MQKPQSRENVSFDELREKWQEVPFGTDRARTDAISQINDAELIALLEQHRAVRGEGTDFGWYFPLYQELFRGKRILDVGSGLGIDGLTFLKYGALWTFSDIVKSNLDLVKRSVALTNSPSGQADYFYIEHPLAFLDLPAHFDFIWADGSLLHIPFDAARDECHAIISRLKEGGRWIELTYPKKRWLREGSPPFSKWGEITDGAGTPWAEWYDIEKIKRRLSPAKIRPIFSLDFYNNSCNWHDLQLLEKFEYCEHSKIAEPISISLAAIQSCNGCEVQQIANGVSIITGPDNWSYAATIPLNDAPATIEVECEVSTGSVGVSYIDANNQLVSVEKIVDAGDTASPVVDCYRIHEAKAILFRNTSGAGKSYITISNIFTR